MLIILGYIILMLSILGGYSLAGGHLITLFQPVIFVMVIGGGIGIFYAANNSQTIRQVLIAFATLLKSDRASGNLLRALEEVLADLGNGDQDSTAKVVRDTDAKNRAAGALHSYVLRHMVESVRLVGLPGMTADEFSSMSATNSQTCTGETDQVSRALSNLGHSIVATGFMVSLLGIIHAGYVSDHAYYMELVSNSLIGAFVGIFLGWGMILPLGNAIRAKRTLLQTQCRCVDLALGAYLKGMPTALALEVGRMALPLELRL